jgi:putative phosphoribosyl transferase
MLFRDRDHAGQLLAQALTREPLERPVVYALPRGGMPVARRIADVLEAPLELVLVRKIGVPWQPEVAAAAVADGGRPQIVFNEDVMAIHGLTRDTVEQLAVQELYEIERRRQLYVKDRPLIDVRGRDAIIVDDGIATGATFKCALHAIRRRNPARIIAAVPVASTEAAHEIERLVDRLVCLAIPERLDAVSQYYGDFSQLTDDNVIRQLGPAKERAVSARH